ncbi:MAG: hypothetical protein ACP5N6_14345 [Anaerolineae bacterium]
MIPVETIRFPNGRAARVVRASPQVSPDALLAALDLGFPRALVVLCGGAGGMSQREIEAVRPLIVDGLARLAAQEQIAILDGGTNSGVMALVGEGAAHHGLTAPLIGVCPAAKVSWPGNPNPLAEAELEPHHSHFVLTPGNEFGAESRYLYALAEALGARVPSLALLINGGRLALQEALLNVRQCRPLVVFKGSGRVADVVAGAREAGSSDDPVVAEIIRSANLVIFDICAGPEYLVHLIRDTLWRESHEPGEHL